MQDVMRKQFYKQRLAFELDAAERDKTQSMPAGVTIEHDVPYMDDGIEAHQMAQLTQ